MLVDRQPTQGVQRQTIRAGLAVFADVHSAISTVRAINRNTIILGPAINQIVVRVAEEQVSAVLNPNGSFREHETASQLLDLGAGCDDGIERRVHTRNLRFDFLDSCAVTRLVEIERGRFHPDEIHRAFGNRSVETEHRDLELLTRLRVVREDDFVRSVPAFDDRAAALAEHCGQLSVHPDFGVVVDHDFERDRGTCNR